MNSSNGCGCIPIPALDSWVNGCQPSIFRDEKQKIIAEGKEALMRRVEQLHGGFASLIEGSP